MPIAEKVADETAAHAVITAGDLAADEGGKADVAAAAKESAQPEGGAKRPARPPKRRLSRRFEDGDSGVSAPAQPAPPGIPPDQAKTNAKIRTSGSGAKPPKETQAPKAKKPASSASDGELPEKLGPFLIRGKLGEGGMGMVLNAYDPQLDRKIAIKVLSNRLGQDAEFVQRFLAEARAVARVSHPNVAGVFFADSENDQHFFAMEYIEGESLDTKVERDGPMTPKAAIGYVMQTVRGLSAAAERGIVHRDIKPANVMVTREGEVKVMDFGLAKLSGQDLKLTQAGTVLGSPHFMAPEQGRGEDTDLRTDIYSLGATLYYLVVARPPYAGDTALAVILKHQESPVPQIERAPPSLNRLLSKMMGKKQEERYASYSELMKDLVRLDKSGLLRDEIIQSDESGSNAPAVQAVPANQGITAPGPPTARPISSSGTNTQRTDDAAALMSKLDALMKDSRPAPRPVPTEEAAPGLGRRMTSAVNKMLNKEPAPRPEITTLDTEDEDSKLPVGVILLAVGAVVVVLVLLILRPWSRGARATDATLANEDPAIVEALENLKPMLSDESPTTRRHAIATIRRTCKSAGGELCAINALKDEDANVRIEAARTIAEFRRTGAAGRIAKLLGDSEPDVRATAATLLVELTGHQPLLRIDWRTDSASLRESIHDEFMEWLRTRGSDD